MIREKKEVELKKENKDLKLKINNLKKEDRLKTNLIFDLKQKLYKENNYDILLSNLIIGLNKYISTNENIINELLADKNNTLKFKANNLYKYFIRKFYKDNKK